jgi:hypothetical protein
VLKSGDTMSGPLTVNSNIYGNGDVYADRLNYTGYFMCTKNGGIYYGYDGASLVINGAPCYITSNLTVAGSESVGSDLSVAGSIWVNNGHLFFRGNGGIYLNHDGTNYNLAGSPLFIHSNCTVTGQMISYGADSYRIAYGAYGTFWRNDGATLYLMLTNAWDSLGTWSGHRPITVDLASGICNINGGQPVRDGRLAMAGDVTIYGAFQEPYGGAVVTGTNSIIYRFRYMQLCNTGWWTIGYA